MEKSTTENIAIDLLIAIIFGVFHFFAIFILFISFYGFLDCCGETCLDPWSNFSEGIKLPIIVAIFEIILVFILCKSRGIIFIFSLYIAIITMLVAVTFKADIPNRSDYYEEFDSQKWRAKKPIEMVRVFFEDKRFIGKTSSDVIELLGEDYSEKHTKDGIYYWTSGYSTTLIFTFKNDTVVNYELECYD